MKNGIKILIAVVAVVLVLVGIVAGGYNSLVDAQTAVEQSRRIFRRSFSVVPILYQTLFQPLRAIQNMSRRLSQRLQRQEARLARPLMPRLLHRQAMSLTGLFPSGLMLLRKPILTSRQIRIMLRFRMSLQALRTE